MSMNNGQKFIQDNDVIYFAIIAFNLTSVLC